MTLNKHDDLYAAQQRKIKAFKFDEQVADVFDDMISRSVPGYRDIVSMIGFLAQEYFKPGTQCYDLGCSLGAVSAEILKHTQDLNSPIIAVDNSPAMLERCKKNILPLPGSSRLIFQCADIRDISIENASLVVLNFVLQFIVPDERKAVLKKIAAGLSRGGVLILSEKIFFPDEKENEIQQRLHHTFKKLNGYSDMEISQKRTALENVLIPDCLEDHHRLLTESGFAEVYTWFRCFNFASLIALKL